MEEKLWFRVNFAGSSSPKTASFEETSWGIGGKSPMIGASCDDDLEGVSFDDVSGKSFGDDSTDLLVTTLDVDSKDVSDAWFAAGGLLNVERNSRWRVSDDKESPPMSVSWVTPERSR